MLSFFLLAGLTVLLLAVALFLFLKSKAFAGGMTLIAVGLSGYVSFLALETNIKPQVEEKNQIAAEERKKSLARAKALADQGIVDDGGVGVISGITASQLDSMEGLTPEEKKEMQKMVRGIETGETFKAFDKQLSDMSKMSETNSQPTMGEPSMPAAGR